MSSGEFLVNLSGVLGVPGRTEHHEASANILMTESGLTISEKGSPVSISFEVECFSGGMKIRGKIEGSLTLECHICLEPFSKELSLDIEEYFAIANRGAGKTYSEECISEDVDSDDNILREGNIDLLALINDAVLTSLGMTFVCREKCKGICHGCGANLNLQECNCE